jgi:hypothetical protein
MSPCRRWAGSAWQLMVISMYLPEPVRWQIFTLPVQGVSVAVTAGVLVGVLVGPPGVLVRVAVGVLVRVKVLVGTGVLVGIGVLVRVAVAPTVVLVAVGTGVLVLVGTGVLVRVNVGTGVKVGVAPAGVLVNVGVPPTGLTVKVESKKSVQSFIRAPPRFTICVSRVIGAPLAQTCGGANCQWISAGPGATAHQPT